MSASYPEMPEKIVALQEFRSKFRDEVSESLTTTDKLMRKFFDSPKSQVLAILNGVFNHKAASEKMDSFMTEFAQHSYFGLASNGGSKATHYVANEALPLVLKLADEFSMRSHSSRQGRFEEAALKAWNACEDHTAGVKSGLLIPANELL